MSLINNMLKDLEKRKSIAPEIPHIALLNSSRADKFITPRWLISLLVCIGSMLILLVFAKIFKAPAIEPAITQPENNKIMATTFQHEPIQNATENHWINPVTIAGITVSAKENDVTELSFLLNHAALYRVVSHTPNQLTLAFDHAELQSELPAINYLNTAIEKLSATQQDGEVLFDLALYPGAVIQTIQLNEGEKPELVIAIKYHKPAPSTQSLEEIASSAAIKTPALQSMLLEQYQLALKAAESNHYQLALDKLTSIITIAPDYKDARVSLAALLMDQGGNDAKAAKIIDDGLILDPDYSPFIELKARLLTLTGKINQALSLLLNNPPSMDDNPEYHAFIAALYERSNHDRLAADQYKKLLALNPQNGNWWLGLGIAMEKLGKIADAVYAYNKAITEGHLNAESASYLQNHLKGFDEVKDVAE